MSEAVAKLLRDIIKAGGAPGLPPLDAQGLNAFGSILDRGGWRFSPEEAGLVRFH